MPKIDLAKIGTDKMPIHASAIPSLIKCPLSYVLACEQSEEERGKAGEAADTGTAVHFAARIFHTLAKGDSAISLEIMRREANRYPFADLSEAEKQFLYYSQDSRNQKAQIEAVEKEIKFTQKEVTFVGTLDQLRRNGRTLGVYDIKTGKSGGLSLLNYHAYQLACYQVGASKLLGERVEEAWVIRVKDYIGRNTGPVFYQAPWSYAQAKQMIESVCDFIHSLREGKLWANPSEFCFYCPGSNVSNCLIQLGSYVRNETLSVAI